MSWPLHPVYAYSSKDVWVVNSLYAPAPAAVITAKLFCVANYRLLNTHATHLPAIAEDAAIRVGPAFAAQAADEAATCPGTRLLRLTVVADDQAAPPIPNDYLLPATPDVVDYSDCTFYRCGLVSYADYLDLSGLADVHPEARVLPGTSGRTSATVSLRNPSQTTVAVFVRVRLFYGGDKEVLPVSWSDNYVNLLPSETRNLTAFWLDGSVPVDGHLRAAVSSLNEVGSS